MAKFRKIETIIWSDSWFSELDRDKKLFYLYILTNEHTKQCGIYEITKRKISFDLGCSIDTVCKQLEYFKKEDKLMYSEETNEIAIRNWAKYNYSKSPKVVKCIESELCDVKDTVLIEYINGMYTLSQEEEEKEEEEVNAVSPSSGIDEDKLRDLVYQILGKNYRVFNDKAKKQLKDRLKEGYTKTDFVTVITNASKDQYHLDNNYKYLTLEFLTRPDKFERFLHQSEFKKQPKHL